MKKKTKITNVIDSTAKTAEVKDFILDWSIKELNGKTRVHITIVKETIFALFLAKKAHGNVTIAAVNIEPRAPEPPNINNFTAKDLDESNAETGKAM